MHLLALVALLLTGWQLHIHPYSALVWLFLLLATLGLLISWRRSLLPGAVRIVGLEPAYSHHWGGRVKGRREPADLEIVDWTRVGALLGLVITSADPNMNKVRVLLLSDQCSPEQWRRLLSCLNWMGAQKR